MAHSEESEFAFEPRVAKRKEKKNQSDVEWNKGDRKLDAGWTRQPTSNDGRNDQEFVKFLYGHCEH